ncbi:Uncharacterised protein [Bordetella pertussis]|nr:Uncharacterised protein [Bordetella pertussis]
MGWLSASVAQPAASAALPTVLLTVTTPAACASKPGRCPVSR